MYPGVHTRVYRDDDADGDEPDGNADGQIPALAPQPKAAAKAAAAPPQPPDPDDLRHEARKSRSKMSADWFKRKDGAQAETRYCRDLWDPWETMTLKQSAESTLEWKQWHRELQPKESKQSPLMNSVRDLHARQFQESIAEMSSGHPGSSTDDTWWKCYLDTVGYDRESQATVFDGICVSSCEVHIRITQRHRKPPYSWFRILEDYFFFGCVCVTICNVWFLDS